MISLVIKGGRSGPKPPGQGWQVIPKGQHGGYRRRSRGGWEYWYPARAPRPGYQEPEATLGTTLDDAVERREKYQVPIVVSYGAGVDSTAMLVGMFKRGIRPDAILFADVGSERQMTYAYLGVMNDWLKRVGFPEITVVRRDPTTSRKTGTVYTTLEQQCIQHETLASQAFGRHCKDSGKWKHGPQEKLVNSWDMARKAWERGFKVTKLIGYSADPKDARRHDFPDDDKYHYQYPLREWGWDRKRSAQEIASVGLPVPVKSACWFCPATKPDELRGIIREAPDLGRRIIQMEAGAEPHLRSVEGLWRRPVQGHRGSEKKPSTMTEWIVGEELLPEFEGQKFVDPWWRREGPQKPTNPDFKPSDVVGMLRPAQAEPSPMERLSGLKVATKLREDVGRDPGRPGPVPSELNKEHPVQMELALSMLKSWYEDDELLLKAIQMGLFGGGAKPPGAGWELIPRGKHGGYRKRKGDGYEYWYPEMAMPKREAAEEKKPEPEEEEPGDIRKSKRFKAWFGDWERGQGSRVVKKDGSPAEQWGPGPIVVYHGTAVGGFTSFDPKHDKGNNLYGKGFYFTREKKIAETYTAKDSGSRAAATNGLEVRGKRLSHLSASVAEAFESDILGYAKKKYERAEAWGNLVEDRVFGSYDGNMLWALEAAREADGRVNIERFIAEFWKPSDMTAARKYAEKAVARVKGSFPKLDKPARPPEILPEITETFYADGMWRQLKLAAKNTGLEIDLSIPDPQVFEVFLNVRKPIDMDAEPTDAQLQSFSRWWAKRDHEELQAKIADREKTHGADDESVKEWKRELKRRERESDGLAHIETTMEALGAYGDDLTEHTWDRSGPRNWIKLNRAALMELKRTILKPGASLKEGISGGTVKALRVALPTSKLTWGDVYVLMSDGFRNRDAQQRFRDWGESEGHDGIRHTGGWNVGEKEHEVWIAWNPTQIKSTSAKEFDPSSPDIYKHSRLVLDLLKAEQLSLFVGARKPPGAGWEMIPKGKHGGYRRRRGSGYVYWYPDTSAIQELPRQGDPAEKPEEPPAAPEATSAPAPALPAIPRSELKRTHRAVSKNSELAPYGYQIVQWVNPRALAAAAAEDREISPGGQVFEYVPVGESTTTYTDQGPKTKTTPSSRPRYTATTYEQQVAVHRAIGAPVKPPGGPRTTQMEIGTAWETTPKEKERRKGQIARLNSKMMDLGWEQQSSEPGRATYKYVGKIKTGASARHPKLELRKHPTTGMWEASGRFHGFENKDFLTTLSAIASRLMQERKLLTTQPPESSWSSGGRPDTSGMAAYTIMIRHPGDPDDKRVGPRGRDVTPHQTFKKMDLGEIKASIAGHLADGAPRTLHRMSVELWNEPADVTAGTKVQEALWQLVEEGKVEVTLGYSPVMFRAAKQTIETKEPAASTQEQAPREPELILDPRTEKRQANIRKLVDEGKLAHEEVGWAMFAVKDAAEKVATEHAGRYLTDEMEAPIREAAAKLYEVEKRHGARPTTARGVREALGIPENWPIPETNGKEAAYLVHLPLDRRMHISWSPSRGQFMAWRDVIDFDPGGRRYTKNVDKKKHPAAELVQREIERERAIYEGWKQQQEQEKRAEELENERGPVYRGEALIVDTHDLPRPKKNAKRFDAGLEWAESVLQSKMNSEPDQVTERRFHEALAGRQPLGEFMPTPRQYRALKSLETIADRKLYAEPARPGQPERRMQPELTPAKEAFWRGVAAFAARGVEQWTEGEDSPMSTYVKRFRDYISGQTTKGGEVPDVIKSMLLGPPRLIIGPRPVLRLVLDLEKARQSASSRQLGMFGFGAARPPGGGWEMIPKGKHGGYRRRRGDHYEYWYPDKAAIQAHPEPGDVDEKPKVEPEPVPVEEERREEVTEAMSKDRTKGQRKQANDEALKIVMRARSEGRGLTDEEAVKVASYTGKGGISGDLNQFYTRTDLAEAMWDVLRTYQTDAAKVLEPSCGSGVFLQTAPKGAKVTGVELDDQAAAVAEVLHSHKGHSVESKSFELFTIERMGTGPQFDAAIGNPPYCTRTGDIPRHKPEFKSADQYFVDTSLDHIKDGGVAVLLIHGGVLNNRSPGAQDFRERLLARAEIVDAFRCPNDIFAHVHCGIGADVLVLRKRDSLTGQALMFGQARGQLEEVLTELGAWDGEFVRGDYFEKHPDRILGKALSADETGWRATVIGDADKVPGDIRRLTADKIKSGYQDPASKAITPEELGQLEIGKGLLQAAQPVLARAAVPPVIGNVETIANQRYLYIGDPPKWTLMESIDDVSQIIERSGDEAIKQAHQIALELQELIRSRDAGEFYKARAIRRRAADRVRAWVKENGIPGSHRALGVLSKSAPTLLDFIACVDSNGELSDLLSKDAAITLKPSEVDRADLLSVAGYVARRNRGYINLEDIQHNWEGWVSDDDTRRRLLESGEYALDGTSAGAMQHLEDYLTGNLYEKLDIETVRAESLDGEERVQVERQIALLRQRLETRRRTIDDIPIQLRVMNWMPIEWFNAWLNSPEGRKTVFGRKPREPGELLARLTYDQGVYTLEMVKESGEVTKTTSDGTDWLKYMNRLSLKREKARDVEEHIEKSFDAWIKASELRSQIEELYNRTFCGEFRREYSGDPLPLEGIREGVIPHNFQNQAVRWAAETGRGILGQDVGLGKTFIAILLARLRKQQGLARRPMVVCPKSVATNWAEEVETLFPGSRVLVIGEHRIQSRAAKKKAIADATAKGLEGDAFNAYVEANSWATSSDDDLERNRKLAMVKQNEYDLIICTKPAFERIPLKHETIERYEKEDFWYQRAGRIDTIVSGSKTQETQDKRIEKLKADWASDKLQQKFKHEMAMVYWEDLGIDTLIADEAHAYKNLYAARSRFGKNPKFLGGSGQSKQARKMQHMAHYLRESGPTNGVYFLTATPTKNSPLEVFNMLQHIAPESFQAMGIDNSEQFIDRFCKLEDRLILVPPGKKVKAAKDEEDEDETQFHDDYEGAGNLEEAQCVVGFTNLKELESVMDKYMLLQTATDVGLKIPEAKQEMHLVDMTATQKAIYADLRAQAQETDTKEDPGGMFRMLDQMKKAAQDLSLYDPEAYPDGWRESPKYKACADEAYRGAMERGGQIIFLDHNAGHERMKALLMERGLREDQIGIINAQVAADSAARQAIGNRFNKGEIKVVIGNTGTMGEGVNLQGKKAPKGTTDIHHLDQPWDPGTQHQRNGRGVRQGNKAEQVQIHTYLARGSFDGFRHSTLMGKERWLDKLRSGADTIDNDMDGQSLDEVEMLAMLSDNPDAALAAIKEKRASAESAWYARQSQQAVDTFYSYQRKIGRLERMAEGESRDRLAEETARIKRQLLRSELLPLEIKDVLNSGDTRPAAVNTFLTGEGDARRLAARIIRAGTVIQAKETGYGEPSKLVVDSIDLTERKVTVRSWGYPHAHSIGVDQVAEQGYTISKYTAVDELKEALAKNAETSYLTPLEAVGHISPDVLEANRDMVDESMRAWLAKHGRNREILVRRGDEIVPVEADQMPPGAQIVYPWGKDRAELVRALAEANKGPSWREWDNPLLRVGRENYGYSSSSYRPGLFNQVAQEAESAWKERRAAA